MYLYFFESDMFVSKRPLSHLHIVSEDRRTYSLSVDNLLRQQTPNGCVLVLCPRLRNRRKPPLHFLFSTEPHANVSLFFALSSTSLSHKCTHTHTYIVLLQFYCRHTPPPRPYHWGHMVMSHYSVPENKKSKERALWRTVSPLVYSRIHEILLLAHDNTYWETDVPNTYLLLKATAMVSMAFSKSFFSVSLQVS